MRIWEVFPEIIKAIKAKHEEMGLFGHHDWFHALRVGEMARRIAFDEWNDERLSRLAGVAGLCHNADHLIYKNNATEKEKDMYDALDDEVPRGVIEELVLSWLSLDKFSEEERSGIVNAVTNHTAENLAGDSRLVIALKDADRVVNLEIDAVIRTGQYHSRLPVIDYKYFLDNPKATFRKPISVLKGLALSLDWVNPKTSFCVRTKMAKTMANERAAYLKEHFNLIRTQLEDGGLHPYPFED